MVPTDSFRYTCPLVRQETAHGSENRPATRSVKRCQLPLCWPPERSCANQSKPHVASQQCAGLFARFGDLTCPVTLGMGFACQPVRSLGPTAATLDTSNMPATSVLPACARCRCLRSCLRSCLFKNKVSWCILMLALARSPYKIEASTARAGAGFADAWALAHMLALAPSTHGVATSNASGTRFADTRPVQRVQIQAHMASRLALEMNARLALDSGRLGVHAQASTFADDCPPHVPEVHVI